MRRRRQETLWIHKWSRPMIAAIATIGAIGTGYLTVMRFSGGSAACGSGCGKVLSSAWATVFGQPLTLFGCLAYLSMLVLAVAPLFVSPEKDKDFRAKLEGWTWPLLFVGATGMMIFSGFLMYVLATQIEALCPYCIASALFTVAMFFLTLFGRRWDDRGQLLFSGAIIAMIAFVGTLGIYAVPGAPLSSGTQAAITAPGDGVSAPVTNPSGDAEIALAKHLTDVGAKMYGAYWCPHCFDQKQLFGQVAYKDMPYIECADDGKNNQAALCASEGIRQYPIWRVNGVELAGTQTLETLAEASGYTGPTDFVN
ncbi:MAG: vitamin K epoxide reductase family protein [Cyanobacteria bacterium J06621_3]